MCWVFPKNFEKYERTLRDLMKTKFGKSPSTPQEINDEFLKPEIMNCLGQSLYRESGPLYNGIQIESGYSNCIFSSPYSILLVKNNLEPKDRFFLMDATFRITPRGTFQQVLIIYIKYGIKVRIRFFFVTDDSIFVPLVWILMSRRTVEAYEAAINFIHQNLIEMEGHGMIIDYENAMRTALKKMYPNLPVYGCLFHFMQATHRKMASMTTLYDLIRTNEDAKFIFRKFQSLALLPARMIKDEFVSLLREALNTHKFTEFAQFVEYFKNQWINRVKPVHFSVFNLETRTTGPAEAYNGKANKSFRTHGAFFQFVETLQKEETVKTDQFSRDVSGIFKPDRRRNFYKKRAELISKYWTQLEKRIITPRLFVSIMANVNNEILYDEKMFFTHETDIQLSNETALIEGEDIEQSTNAVITEDENEKELSLEERPQSIGRKRKSAEMIDIVDENLQSKPKKRKQTTTTAIDTRRTTRSKTNQMAQSSQSKSTTSRVKRTATTTVSAIDTTNRSQPKSATRVTRVRTNRAHVPLDDDSEPDVADTDSCVYEIMERITRNGPSMVSLRKRFKELENQENILIDSDSFKYIICHERRKNTILFPCLHQHTCGPCWIIWKIHQINTVPLSLTNTEDEIDEAVKPKCPVCRQGVNEFREAKN